MTNYKKLYFSLYNALTDALTAMDEKKVIYAIELLRRAQIQAEEAFISPRTEETFMDIIFPFTEQQLDRLWGSEPMATPEQLADILSACREDWADSAYSAIAAHYPDLYARLCARPSKALSFPGGQK